MTEVGVTLDDSSLEKIPPLVLVLLTGVEMALEDSKLLSVTVGETYGSRGVVDCPPEKEVSLLRSDVEEIEAGVVSIPLVVSFEEVRTESVVEAMIELVTLSEFSADERGVSSDNVGETVVDVKVRVIV